MKYNEFFFITIFSLVGTTQYFLFGPHNFKILTWARLDGSSGWIQTAGRQLMITGLAYALLMTFTSGPSSFISHRGFNTQ